MFELFRPLFNRFPMFNFIEITKLTFYKKTGSFSSYIKKMVDTFWVYKCVRFCWVRYIFRHFRFVEVWHWRLSWVPSWVDRPDIDRGREWGSRNKWNSLICSCDFDRERETSMRIFFYTFKICIFLQFPISVFKNSNFFKRVPSATEDWYQSLYVKKQEQLQIVW